MLTKTELPLLRTTLRAETAPHPRLLDFSAFIYDFNFIYEIYRLSLDPNYDEVPIRSFRSLHTRYGRPLDDGDRLRVQSLSMKSPFEVVALVPVIGAAVASVWSAVQILHKVTISKMEAEKLRLDNVKSRLEIEKLRLDNDKATLELDKLRQELGSLQSPPGLSESVLSDLPDSPLDIGENSRGYIETVEKQLYASPMALYDYEFRIVVSRLEDEGQGEAD